MTGPVPADDQHTVGVHSVGESMGSVEVLAPHDMLTMFHGINIAGKRLGSHHV